MLLQARLQPTPEHHLGRASTSSWASDEMTKKGTFLLNNLTTELHQKFLWYKLHVMIVFIKRHILLCSGRGFQNCAPNEGTFVPLTGLCDVMCSSGAPPEGEPTEALLMALRQETQL